MTQPVKTLRHERLIVAAILAASLLFRAAYFFLYSRALPFLAHPTGDALVYLDWARQIAGGGTPVGVFYRAPLYPYFVALVLKAGAGLLPVYIIHVLLGLGTLGLVYLVARRVFNPSVAVVSLFLAALCSPLVFYESKLLSATVVVFLIALALLLLVIAGERRRRWLWFVVGCCFGAAAVAWAGSLLIFLVTCVWALAGREAGRKALPLGIVGCLAVVSVATIHNAVVGSDLVPISANSGFTFYQGNNRLAAGTLAQPPEVLEVLRAQPQLGDIARQDELELEIVKRELRRVPKWSAVSSFWTSRALSWLVRNPGAAVVLLGRKLALAFADYESPSDYNIELEAERVGLIRLGFFRFGLLLALALTGIFLARPRHAWPLYAACSGTLAALLVFYVADRYRLPAYPALAVLAGNGIYELWRHGRHRRLSAVPMVILTVTIVVTTFALNLLLRRGSNQLLANSYRNLGQAYLQAGSPARAESAMTRAVLLYAANVDTANLQQRMAFDEARLALAQIPRTRPYSGPTTADSAATIAQLQTELAGDSANRHLYLRLGSLLGEQGRHLEALDVFRRAMVRFPDDPVLRYNVALSALNSGDHHTALTNAETVLTLVPGHPWAQRIADRARNLRRKE